MKITRDNYELFFINYLDGTLSEEEKKDLLTFVNLNPDLGAELELMNSALVLDLNKKTLFPDKNSLKKTISDKEINSNNIDEFLIAFLENDLHPDELNKLETFLYENPQYKNDLELLKRTYLKPDLSVTFNNKRKLKKYIIGQNIELKHLYSAVAVAASLILIVNIFINYSFFNDNETSTGRMASKNDTDFLNVLAVDNSIGKDVEQGHTELQLQKTLIKKDNLIKHEAFYPERASTKRVNNIEVQSKKLLAYEDRKEYSNIYHYVKQAEMNLIDEDYADVLPGRAREPFLKYTADKFFANRSSKNEFGGEGRLGFWEVVDIGTYGINTLADKNIFSVSKTKENEKTRLNFALGNNVIYSVTQSKD